MFTIAENLLSAMKAGDVAAVRACANRLLFLYSHPSAKRFAASALLWCGDTRLAMQHLAPNDQLRAIAHPQRVISVEEEFTGRALEYLRVGDWENGRAALRELRELFLNRDDGQRLGLGPLSLVGGGECPTWNGDRVDHLVLVACFGDGTVFHFARYVRMVRERCDRLTLALQQPLHAIARRLLPIDDLIELRELRPYLQRANAYEVVEFWLPCTLGVEYEPPLRIEPIAGTVPDLGPGAHIGLCWAASARTRTIPFAAFEPLRSLAGVTCHSLQVGPAADEAAEWVTRHELTTYDDTTSLIAALDAVVTVDTSVAHLAGNIGKPVHLILTAYEDWRWGTGERTPWYPTMTIYRGDVDRSVQRIREMAGVSAGETMH
jgi:hypothetical protein